MANTESALSQTIAPNLSGELLTLWEVRDLCKVTAVSIWRWRRSGRFPKPIRLAGGRHLRWRRSDVVKWLEEQHT